MTSLCMQFLFSGERGKYHFDESALPVTKKERNEKGKNASEKRKHLPSFTTMKMRGDKNTHGKGERVKIPLLPNNVRERSGTTGLRHLTKKQLHAK